MSDERRAEQRLLSFEELRSRKGVAFSRQHIHKLMRQNLFPKPVKAPGGGQHNFWIESEIDAYIDDMIRARDTAPAGDDDPRVARMRAGREAKRKVGTVHIERRKPRAENCKP